LEAGVTIAAAGSAVEARALHQQVLRPHIQAAPMPHRFRPPADR
jgi:hypothetical protein